MDRPSLHATSVTIGTDDPALLADFYARLLGGRVTAQDPPHGDDAGWAQVATGDPGRPGLTLNFEHERQFRRPTWPASPDGQNATQHLDVLVEDLAAATAWAIRCGAVLAAAQPQQDVRVLLDPSGHPFCLFT
ncbi:glyoxalase [Cellulomonas sp. A375-1]|uniref:VOC family protein n=1 Tax=Cellulomonas sp. A375-1 TaxID=1672219 RepID=UPI00065283C4|nr:VOC family protein [Cellulomonas sp. A375-1]KMM46136.1 glyoxalase [Cellulomonas sp. A375-1]